MEIKKIIRAKLERAKQRKRYMQCERNVQKMKAEVDYFKKHSLFRQETLLKNIKLVELHEKQQQENLEVI